MDAFDDLVGLAPVFPHPNLRVDVLAVAIDEVRVPRRRWPGYAVDWFQRCVLFWDTLRQRGNNFLAHERAGKPPLLAF